MLLFTIIYMLQLHQIYNYWTDELGMKQSDVDLLLASVSSFHFWLFSLNFEDRVDD